MVFLLRPVVAYTLPQLQYKMKINIVPGDFSDMPECDSYCFMESVYWQCHIILFRALNIINSVYIFKATSVRLLQFS